MRTSGAELGRIESTEARLILDGSEPADLKLARIRENVPFLTGKKSTL